MRCDKCKFWELNMELVDGDLGWCRRYPPTIPLSDGNGGFCHTESFSNQWCGEFKEASRPVVLIGDFNEMQLELLCDRAGKYTSLEGCHGNPLLIVFSRVKNQLFYPEKFKKYRRAHHYAAAKNMSIKPIDDWTIKEIASLRQVGRVRAIQFIDAVKNGALDEIGFDEIAATTAG